MIPETTAQDAERLADLRITLGLGINFDILGDENLAPACHGCNSDKLAHLFRPVPTALFLRLVKDRLPKFYRLKARYEKQANKDDAMWGCRYRLRKVLSHQQKSETSSAGMKPSIWRSTYINRFNSSAVFPWRHFGGRKWTSCSTSR